MKKMRTQFALLTCLAMLGGCSLIGLDGDGVSSTARPPIAVMPIDAPMPDVPQGLEKFYGQGVTWEECGDGFVCGQYTVPLDYSEPDGKKIRIVAKKHSASGERIGSLLVNPGGPGASGQDLAQYAEYYFPSEVLEHFDIVGFDPRGVGDSSPVDCVGDAELSNYLETTYPDTPEGEAHMLASAKEYVAGCEAKSGDLLPFIGTEYVARDMDVIRHVEGDPKLYYVGYSYGTEIGAEYAQLFPKNVGRLVLDGAVAATKTNFEESKDQLVGFERSLDLYLEDCLANDSACPFEGDLQAARAAIIGLFDRALKEPLPTSNPDEPLTQATLLYGMITPLYSSEYSTLSDAFSGVFDDDDGSIFKLLADQYFSRVDGEFLDNSMEANIAVSCADNPVEGDQAQWDKAEDELAEVAPVFGPVFGYDESLCAMWPYQPQKALGPFVGAGADPIVVLGTSGDPATPYEWAQDMANSLESAVLVTWEGTGHTAYGRSNDCIAEPINEYLLNGTVPHDGRTCSPE